MSRSVVVTIPCLGPWGTEAQTLRLAQALRRDAWAVRVVCFYEAEDGVVAGLAREGAAVTLLGMQRADGVLRLARRLGRDLRRWRPDVLHVQYLTPGLAAVLAGRLAGVARVFATVHQSAAGYGGRERALMRAAAAAASAVLCVSRAVEESWFGSSRLFLPEGPGAARGHCTLYNTLEPAAPAPVVDGGAARAALGLQGRRVVGVVGRLTREKGHETLLAALPLLRARCPDAALLVVGSGPEEGRLRAQAQALGVERSIVWAGWRPPALLPEVYAAADVVAVPSRTEGFGLVAAEAAAAGRAVVASAVGGLAEVVEPDVTGLLVPPGNAAALAAALGRLLEEPALRGALGERGRLRARERFGFERYAASVRALYAGGAR